MERHSDFVDFVIRRATLDDAPLMAGLNRHVQQLHLDAEPTLYRVTDHEELVSWFRERIASPGVTAFVAEDEAPLGYAMALHERIPRNPFRPERVRLVVDQIAVVEGARRRGVGRRLMAAAEQLARELGVERMQLDVRAFNAGAIRFYEALGFTPALLRLERVLT
jgi:ribosomal protein S18 acetylase RimI-like enzyme